MNFRSLGVRRGGQMFSPESLDLIKNTESINISQNAPLVIDQNELVLDWDSSQHDGSGVLQDLTSFNNDGTISEGVEFGSDSIGDYYTSFQRNEYIGVTDPNWENEFPLGDEDRTLISVFKTPTNTDSQNQFHIFHYGSTSWQAAFGLSILSNYEWTVGQKYTATFGAHWWNGVDYPQAPALDDTAYVVVLRFSSENASTEININGVWYPLEYRTYIDTGTNTPPRAGERIGPGEPLQDGKIYRNMLYKRALSNEEVEQLVIGLTNKYNITYEGTGQGNTQPVDYGNYPTDNLSLYIDLSLPNANNVLKDYSGNNLHLFSGNVVPDFQNEVEPYYIAGFGEGATYMIPNFYDWDSVIPTGSDDRTIAIAFRTPTDITGRRYHMVQYGSNAASQAYGICITNEYADKPELSVHVYYGQINLTDIEMLPDTDYVAVVRYSENVPHKIDFYVQDSLYQSNPDGLNYWNGNENIFPLNTKSKYSTLLGRRIPSGEDFSDGRIYGFLIYDRYVNDQEVIDIYNQMKTNHNIS
jgi:hypothetical protein